MRTLVSIGPPVRFAAFAAVAVLISGCGSGVVQTGSASVHSYARSWIAPQAKSGALLYLSDVASNDVAVYSYPKGELVGSLTGLGRPRGECADDSGNVWISDEGTASMIEYAHGNSDPIKALSTQGKPGGCSVNPLNGDLAVAGGRNGTVVSIFHHGKRWRDATTYSIASMKTGYFCAYDASGNLFVDGKSKSGAFALAVLPRKAAALQNVTVDQSISAPGNVQWDSKYLAVGDAGVAPTVVYQFSISGSTATLIGSTPLDGTTSVRQFWIDGKRLIGPDYDAPVGFWNYPAGGSPTKTLSKVHGYGAAVSVAPSAPPTR
jgi:hypothetical protein